MKTNLLWKIVLILAVLVVFVWGIFLGTDPQKSIEAIKTKGLMAGVQQNIHLGLDLRGGTHLILQVQVNDAVNAETD
jgi:preprotein translocase subunit SecD